MQTKCYACGVETDIPEAFYHKPLSFSFRRLTYCPTCWMRQRSAGAKRRLLVDLALVAAGISLLSLSAENTLGYMFLNFVLFDFFLILAILPHELGHAVVAHLLGLRVFKIIVGWGKTLFKCNLFGFDTEFKSA